MGNAFSDARRRPLVAVLHRRDPRDQTVWSGLPASLLRELEQIGADVLPLRALPPSALLGPARDILAALELARLRARGRREAFAYARKVAELSSELSALQTATIRWRLLRAPRPDGVIQLGSEYMLRAGLRLVTYEDMTVAQAVRTPGWDRWHALRPGSVQGRIRRQGRIYRRARMACLTAPWAAESVISDYGVPASKVGVVGIGINHAPKPVPRDWSTPRYLFVGSDWQRKNGGRVLRAFAQVRERLPSAELDLVGDHPRIERPGVRGHGWLGLDRPGERLRLERLYETTTCLVLPSSNDPSPIAAAEAAAAGVPSIGTTSGGSAFIIGDGGRVVDPEDEIALVQAMEELAQPDVARRLGARALARSPLFTWRAVAERLLRALDLPDFPRAELADFL